VATAWSRRRAHQPASARGGMLTSAFVSSRRGWRCDAGRRGARALPLGRLSERPAVALSLNYSGASLASTSTKSWRPSGSATHRYGRAEAYGFRRVSPSAWMLARTTRIHIGTGIMQIPAADAGDDGHDRDDAGCALGGRFPSRLVLLRPGRWWRVGTASLFGRSVVKTREYVESRPRDPQAREAARVPRRVLPVPYAGPNATGLASRSKVILHGRASNCRSICGGGTEERRARRRDRRRLDPRVLFRAPGGDVFARGSTRLQGRRPRGRGVRHHAMVPVVVGPDAARGRALVKPRVALYVGGHGRARPDILQRHCRDDTAMRTRRRRSRPVPVGQQGRGGGRRAGRAGDEVALCDRKSASASDSTSGSARGVTTLLVAGDAGAVRTVAGSRAVMRRRTR